MRVVLCTYLCLSWAEQQQPMFSKSLQMAYNLLVMQHLT